MSDNVARIGLDVMTNKQEISYRAFTDIGVVS